MLIWRVHNKFYQCIFSDNAAHTNNQKYLKNYLTHTKTEKKTVIQFSPGVNKLTGSPGWDHEQRGFPHKQLDHAETQWTMVAATTTQASVVKATQATTASQPAGGEARPHESGHRQAARTHSQFSMWRNEVRGKLQDTKAVSTQSNLTQIDIRGPAY